MVVKYIDRVVWRNVITPVAMKQIFKKVINFFPVSIFFFLSFFNQLDSAHTFQRKTNSSNSRKSSVLFLSLQRIFCFILCSELLKVAVFNQSALFTFILIFEILQAFSRSSSSHPISLREGFKPPCPFWNEHSALCKCAGSLNKRNWK